MKRISWFEPSEDRVFWGAGWDEDMRYLRDDEGGTYAPAYDHMFAAGYKDNDLGFRRYRGVR